MPDQWHKRHAPLDVRWIMRQFSLQFTERIVFVHPFAAPHIPRIKKEGRLICAHSPPPKKNTRSRVVAVTDSREKTDHVQSVDM